MSDIDNVDTDEPTYFNRQAELLMEILHDMKHIDFETALEKMYEYFPHWREVEFYNPDNHAPAISYLFNTVLLLE